MTAAPHGVDPAAWRAVLSEDIPPPGTDGRDHVTADAFDPEAIAQRVIDREQQLHAVPHHDPVPLARAEGSHVTGAGDSRGRPLPTAVETSGEDIFDRLERQRAAKAIRSPFGDHARPNRYATDVDEDPDRFVTPDLDDEETPWTEPASSGTPSAATTSPATSAGSASSAPTAASSSEAAPEPVHDPRCGTTLTGGGAPRGWVLIRVIGQGQPRRYCSPTHAVDALTQPAAPQPTLRESRNEDRVATTRPARRRAPVASALDVTEVIRRYQDGQTPPQIAAALGVTAKTVRRHLDEAGIQRRDDRSGHSGGTTRDYDPQLVARVRALYELHKLPQAKVAEALGISTKVVQNVMARHGIESRPAAHHAQHGHIVPNNSRSITDRLRDLGLTSHQVKAWALDAGLITVIQRGACPARLVDAYLTAHTTGVTA